MGGMTEEDVQQVQAVIDRVEAKKPGEQHWLYIDPTSLTCCFDDGTEMPIPLPRAEQVRVFRESLYRG